jgi:ribosomal protein S27AE
MDTTLPQDILFIEHGDVLITDKPHCGDCFGGAVEPEHAVTDKPHCGECHI